MVYSKAMTNVEKKTGIHLKFVYLVKLLSNHYETLTSENFRNTSNFEGWGLILVPYKKSVHANLR